jgi:hypothetical protein
LPVSHEEVFSIARKVHFRRFERHKRQASADGRLRFRRRRIATSSISLRLRQPPGRMIKGAGFPDHVRPAARASAVVVPPALPV